MNVKNTGIPAEFIDIALQYSREGNFDKVREIWREIRNDLIHPSHSKMKQSITSIAAGVTNIIPTNTHAKGTFPYSTPRDLEDAIAAYHHSRNVPHYSEPYYFLDKDRLSNNRPENLPSSVKEVFLVSAGNSGASWLVNCLLELDIKVIFDFIDIFIEKDQGWQLRDSANEFKVGHHPVLRKKTHYKFRDDIVVYFVHNYITEPFRNLPAIVMTRDFRDAIYSFYRWYGWSNFDDFLSKREPAFAGLTYMDFFLKFYSSWSDHKPALNIKFEQYKESAKDTLKEVLGFYGIVVDEEQILRAVASSTFEVKQLVEFQFREDVIRSLVQAVLGECSHHYFSGIDSDWQGYAEQNRRLMQILHRECSNIRDAWVSKGARKGIANEHKCSSSIQEIQVIEQTMKDLLIHYGYEKPSENRSRS